MPIIVKAQPGQTGDALIRAFQKKVFNDNLIDELKEREFYQKPSLVRKAKKAAQKRTRRKNLLKMLLDQLQADLAMSQKARDQIRVDTLRFLLGAAFNLQIEKGKDYILTDNDLLNVISKQVKTHKESIEMFTVGKRQDLVDREEAELKILQNYLPAQMDEQEIRNKIQEIKTNNPGADFPTLMKLAMRELRGKADGAIVAKWLKS